MINDADVGTFVKRQADQGTIHRQTGNKRRGTVDRIQYPDVLGIQIESAQFFAGDAVFGVTRHDQIAQGLLDLLIGLRDERTVRLHLDRWHVCRRIQQDGAARIGQFQGKVDQFIGQVVVVHRDSCPFPLDHIYDCVEHRTGKVYFVGDEDHGHAGTLLYRTR